MAEKCVMISILPKWCEKIFTGQKNIEFRKSIPKLKPPFKAYVYCTAGKDTLSGIIRDGEDVYGTVHHGKPIFIKYDKDTPIDYNCRKKKVIGWMTIDEIDKAEWDFGNGIALYGGAPGINLKSGGLLLKDFLKYKGRGDVYGWHITDYKLFDKPLEVTDFALYGCMEHLTRPPQSWCYVNGKEYDAQHHAETRRMKHGA